MKNIKENNKLVIKANKLIEYRGKMTTLEIKLFALIVANINDKQNEQFKEHLIDISPLREATTHKDFYNYMKEVTLRLEDQKIMIEEKDKRGNRSFTSIRLISQPSFLEGSNYLSVYITKDLMPLIYNLSSVFTQYRINNILSLNSSYSIRLYELLKQYEKIRKREISLSNLRGFLGIGDTEYARFGNFEARVLKVAQEEINNKTDIRIKYEKKKIGRRINSILFYIEKRETEKAKLLKLYDIEKLRKEMNINEKFTDEEIVGIYELAVEKTGGEEAYAYIKINYEKMKNKKDIYSRFDYLMSALESDYARALVQIRLNYTIEK